MRYPLIVASPKTGSEAFTDAGTPTGTTVLDFWQWSQSNLIENRTRGILAEFIVKMALGIDGGTRVEWDDFDLVTSGGLKVEVKSGAYVQSWAQAKVSAITFGIGPTAGDSTRPDYDGKIRRRADVYVFCLLHHDQQETLDPLNLDQWTFYVLNTATLDARCPTQKTISLASLLKLGVVTCTYSELRAAVEDAAISTPS